MQLGLTPAGLLPCMHTESQGTKGSRTKRGRTLNRPSINSGMALLQECEVVASFKQFKDGTHDAI